MQTQTARTCSMVLARRKGYMKIVAMPRATAPEAYGDNGGDDDGDDCDDDNDDRCDVSNHHRACKQTQSTAEKHRATWSNTEQDSARTVQGLIHTHTHRVKQCKDSYSHTHTHKHRVGQCKDS
jgi:uncharacterized protein YdaT